MTTNDNDINAHPDPAAVASPAPPPSANTHQGHERRRHSTPVLIGAGLAGLLVGAAGTVAAIAFAWIVSVGPAGPPPPPGPRPMMAQPLDHARGPMPGPHPGAPHGLRPPPPPPGGGLGPGQPPGQPPAPAAPAQPSPHT